VLVAPLYRPVAALEGARCLVVGDSVVAMGIVVVTTLYPRRTGNLRPPPPAEVVSPLSEDSSRMVHKDDDPLCSIPTNMASESFPLRERLGLPKRSMMNSKLPKQMVSPEVSPTLVGLLPLATMVSFSE
jgi:hypothetical protein